MYTKSLAPFFSILGQEPALLSFLHLLFYLEALSRLITHSDSYNKLIRYNWWQAQCHKATMFAWYNTRIYGWYNTTYDQKQLFDGVIKPLGTVFPWVYHGVTGAGGSCRCSSLKPSEDRGGLAGKPKKCDSTI